MYTHTQTYMGIGDVSTHTYIYTQYRYSVSSLSWVFVYIPSPCSALKTSFSAVCERAFFINSLLFRPYLSLSLSPFLWLTSLLGVSLSLSLSLFFVFWVQCGRETRLRYTHKTQYYIFMEAATDFSLSLSTLLSLLRERERDGSLLFPPSSSFFIC